MKLFLLQNGRPKYLWTNRKPEMLISIWFWVYDLEVLETFPAMALAEASCILAFEWVVFSIWSSVTNSNEIAAFQVELVSKELNHFGVRNFVIEGVAVSRHLARNPRAWILPFWSKTDMDPLKQNLCLAPNQKMVRTKKVANYQKIKGIICHSLK